MNGESEQHIGASVMYISVLSKNFLWVTKESYDLYLLARSELKLIMRKLIFWTREGGGGVCG
jgi:hypothetical protein